jgi:hypothetical protein
MSEGPVLTFLAHAPENEAEVEVLARRLRDEARVAVWFGPWDIEPGDDRQEVMELGLASAQVCIICINDAGGNVVGWQNQQMRVAIMKRVQGDTMRVIPLLLPGTTYPRPEQLPPFLALYEPVVFSTLTDDAAFKKLVGGILRPRPSTPETDGSTDPDRDRVRDKVKRQRLQEQLTALVEEHQAVSRQLTTALEASAQVRLRRQLEDLETKIGLVDDELRGLERMN